MKNKITGLMVYYYYVCKRKLWLSSHDISLESEHENVQMGKFIDEYSYSGKRKHMMINNEINLDFIENGSIIHEVKKSRKIEEASIWQVKYYLYYLHKLGVYSISAKIDYPLLKKVIDVELRDEDCVVLEKIVEEIRKTIEAETAPIMPESRSICKKCAYYDLCLI